MQKRIVVLGGVGFIGTHLCLRLLSEGHEVFCVDMRDAANSPLLRDMEQHPRFRYVHHNIINSFAIRCNEIYNLASPSMVRYNKALPVETLKVNVLGSINALDTARSERARVLFGSAGNVYRSNLRGACDGAAVCSSHYILSEGKRAAEALYRAYHAEFGVDTRIARIFNTYGSGADLMDQRVVMKMIVAALRNRDIVVNGSGEQLRTFCWVEDIVDGLIRLMETPAAEQTRMIDLGSDREIPIRALAEKIVALTGSRSRILHEKARPDEMRRLTPDLSTARRELGWTPRIPLSEGLRRTISYAEKELTDKARASLTWVEVN